MPSWTDAGPLLPASAFKPIVDVLANKTIYFLPLLGGNVGAQLSTEGALQFFRDHNVTITNDWKRGDLPSPPSGIDFLVYGGGTVGNLPGKAKHNRKWIVSNYLVEHNLHVVGLPMAHLGFEEPIPDDCTLFARDEVSQSYIPGSKLAPDLALYWKGRVPVREPDSPLGFFLREDEFSKMQKLFKKGLGDPIKFCRSLPEYLDLASRFEEIKTDRLMFAIAGLLQGKRVQLMPDATHKNHSCWKTWLSDMGCQWSPPSPLLS